MIGHLRGSEGRMSLLDTSEVQHRRDDAGPESYCRSTMESPSGEIAFPIQMWRHVHGDGSLSLHNGA